MNDNTDISEPEEPRASKSNYPANSHKSREPQKPADKDREKIKRVTVGEAVQRKRPLGRRIADTFTGDDAKSVGSYLLFDVIIPAAKAMVSDAASQGVERMLFGESRRASSGSGVPGRIGYNRMYPGKATENSSNGRRELSSRARTIHNFDEVILGTRGEATEVLDCLTELVNNYDVAKVSDLYDLVGITGSYTDDKWGWYDLRGADVSRVREGYLLNLPKTSPIE